MKRTLSIALLTVCVALALVACDDDKPAAPAAPSPPPSPAAPEITSSGSGASGGGAIAPAPVPGGAPGATGVPSAGLTVRQTASATVPADRAFASLLLPIPPSRFGPGGPVPIDTQDREELIAALATLGVRREAITLEQSFQYGPFIELRVELPVAELPTKGLQVIDAAERVLGRAQSTGAAFGVRDCIGAFDALRKQALTGAAERARALATLAGVTPGPIIAIAEQQPQNPYGPPAQDPCSSATTNSPKAPATPIALDAKPEVKLNLEVVATYRLGDARVAQGLSVAGAGKATAVADEAYVIVLIEPVYGPAGPRPIDAKDRAALIERLRGLGIAADAITIESQPFGGPTAISVEVPVDKLPKIGDDIVDATNRTIGRAVSQGVQFSHSNCEAVRNEAHKQAFADARTRATALASAATLRLGAPIALAEANVAAFAPDPCDVQPAAFASGGPYGSQLKAFDAERQLVVDAALAVTFAIE